MIGKLQLKQKFLQNKLSLDIGKLSKGIYLIRIINKERAFISKLIKD